MEPQTRTLSISIGTTLALVALLAASMAMVGPVNLVGVLLLTPIIGLLVYLAVDADPDLDASTAQTK